MKPSDTPIEAALRPRLQKLLGPAGSPSLTDLRVEALLHQAWHVCSTHGLPLETALQRIEVSLAGQSSGASKGRALTRAAATPS